MGGQEIDWGRVGRLMRRARIAANIPLRLVGRRVGVTHSAVAAWENGVNRPNLDQLVKLAQVHRCQDLQTYLHLIGLIGRQTPRQFSEWIEDYYAAEDRPQAVRVGAESELPMVTQGDTLDADENDGDNRDNKATDNVNYVRHRYAGTLRNHIEQVEVSRQLAVANAR